MLNDFMNLFTEADVDSAKNPKVYTQKVEDLANHPSYDAGYEAGLNRERGEEVYSINPSDPIHMRAFAQGYNDALLES